MIDLLMYLNLFVMYIIYGTILRGLLSMLLPKGLHQGFDTMILGIRRTMIRATERHETKNAEILFLTRLLIPFLTMFLIEGMVAYLLMEFGEYLAIMIMLFIIRLYVFMNVAPSREDWELMLESDEISRIILILKIVIVISIYTILEISTDNYYPLVVCLIPFTAIKFRRQRAAKPTIIYL